jgi:hypothetical protein
VWPNISPLRCSLPFFRLITANNSWYRRNSRTKISLAVSLECNLVSLIGSFSLALTSFANLPYSGAHEWPKEPMPEFWLLYLRPKFWFWYISTKVPVKSSARLAGAAYKITRIQSLLSFSHYKYKSNYIKMPYNVLALALKVSLYVYYI